MVRAGEPDPAIVLVHALILGSLVGLTVLVLAYVPPFTLLVAG